MKEVYPTQTVETDDPSVINLEALQRQLADIQSQLGERATAVLVEKPVGSPAEPEDERTGDTMDKFDLAA